MKTFLFEEFSQACQMEGVAPSVWAIKNGLGKSTPTSLKNGIRPELPTLKKLFTCWHSEEIGLRIIVAYLKDELARIGVSPDNIEPVLKNQSLTPEIDEDLATIGEFMLRQTNLRKTIHEVAALLRVSEWAKEKPSKAQIEADAAAMRAMAGKRYSVHSKRRRASSS